MKWKIIIFIGLLLIALVGGIIMLDRKGLFDSEKIFPKSVSAQSGRALTSSYHKGNDINGITFEVTNQDLIDKYITWNFESRDNDTIFVNGSVNRTLIDDINLYRNGTITIQTLRGKYPELSGYSLADLRTVVENFETYPASNDTKINIRSLSTNLSRGTIEFETDILTGKVGDNFKFGFNSSLFTLIYNFTNNNSNTARWASPAGRSIFAAGTEASGSQYSNLTSSDGATANVEADAANDEPFWRFNFTINESRGSINWVGINVTARANASETATAYVYNWTSGALITISALNTTNFNYFINLTGNNINNTINSTSNLIVYLEGANYDAGDLIFVDYVDVVVNFNQDVDNPVVNLNTPADNFNSNDFNQTFVVNYTDDTELKNATLYVWNSSNINLAFDGGDIRTAIYNGDFKNVSAQESNPQGFFFNGTGDRMYVLGTNADTVFQYNLSSPWNVSTALVDGSENIGGQELNARTLSFSSNGSYMYVLGTTNDRVFQYSLPLPWVVNSTVAYLNKNLSVLAQEGANQGMWFKPDGTKMFIVGTTNDTVFEYNLTSPWDISTGIYTNKNFSIASQEGNVNSLVFKSDGLKMYITGGNNAVYQYSLGTAWSVSTAKYDEIRFNFTQVGTAGRVFLNDSESAMYILSGSNLTVSQYNLSARPIYSLIRGITNGTIWNFNFTANGTYKWNAYACDASTPTQNCAFNATNRTITIGAVAGGGDCWTNDGTLLVIPNGCVYNKATGGLEVI